MVAAAAQVKLVAVWVLGRTRYFLQERHLKDTPELAPALIYHQEYPSAELVAVEYQVLRRLPVKSQGLAEAVATLNRLVLHLPVEVALLHRQELVRALVLVQPQAQA